MDEGVELDDHLLGIALQDQRLSEARNAGEACARFWAELPRDMPKKMRSALVFNWFQAQLFRLQMVMDTEEYE